MMLGSSRYAQCVGRRGCGGSRLNATVSVQGKWAGSRDLVERRRTLMDQWAAYLNVESGHVVPMVHRHG